MYYINGKVSQNQFTFQLCIYINYFSKTSFYFKMVAVNVKVVLAQLSLMLMLVLI